MQQHKSIHIMEWNLSLRLPKWKDELTVLTPDDDFFDENEGQWITTTTACVLVLSCTYFISN